MRAGWQLLIDRYPEARLLWDVEGPNRSTLRAYYVGGRVIIIHDYADGHGWQAYGPVTDSAEIDATLDAIAGVPKPRIKPHEWSGHPDPTDPANYWIDDDTGERVNAATGERTGGRRA